MAVRIVWNRVAIFLSVHNTKNGKNIPNKHKMYQMLIKYPKCPQNIPDGHKVYQHFQSMYGSQNRDFWSENRSSGNPGLEERLGVIYTQAFSA
jgi:hypothetical protein